MRFLFYFILISQFSVAQNLLGKWVMSIDENTMMIPECYIMEISHNKIIGYSFDSIYYKFPLKIDTINKLLKKGGKEHYKEIKYDLKDSINLTEYNSSIITTENGETTKKFEWNYVKLLPTTINYPLKKIEQKKYGHFYASSFTRPETIIKFERSKDSENTSDNILINLKYPLYRLEKVDSTYFIVYYWKKGHRKWMIPIKEINENYLLVYGVAGRSGFIKMHEIKEIENSNTIFLDRY